MVEVEVEEVGVVMSVEVEEVAEMKYLSQTRR